MLNISRETDTIRNLIKQNYLITVYFVSQMVYFSRYNRIASFRRHASTMFLKSLRSSTSLSFIRYRPQVPGGALLANLLTTNKYVASCTTCTAVEMTQSYNWATLSQKMSTQCYYCSLYCFEWYCYENSRFYILMMYL